MSRNQLEPVVRYLRRMTQSESGGVPDQELLTRFVNNKDEAAFELLLWRHAALVLGVCRRVVRDSHAAEDAFQATFLALTRKASSIGKRELVSRWLYKVAYRAALRAKKSDKPMVSLSNQPESVYVSRPRVSSETTTSDSSEATYHEVRQILDEEVSRLPQKYRASIILCYFQGKTYDEAALQLGCPKGTVSIWLTRARDLLRKRLTRRGLTLSTGALALGLSQEFVQAGVPATLITTTLKAALAFATGKAAAGVVTAQVAQLTQGVLKTMMVNKIKLAGVLVTALVLAGTGGGVVLHNVLTEKPLEVVARALAPAPSGEMDAVQLKKLIDQALQAAEKVEDEPTKAWALMEIAKAQAATADRDQTIKTFEQAVVTAKEISDDSKRNVTLMYIAETQAESGLVKEALKTAEGILSKNTNNQGMALAKVAQAQFRMGDRKAALKTIEDLEERDRGFALLHIATLEAESGDFKAAHKTTESIKDGDEQVQALSAIAEQQCKAGNKKAALQVMQEAFQVADKMVLDKPDNLLHPKYYALANVAAGQAMAGDRKAAWQTIELIGKSSFKEDAMVGITKALAEEGKYKEALELVKSIIGMKHYGFQAIALAQARTKKFKDALATAALIDIGLRFDALVEIGRMQARAGDLSGGADSFNQALKSIPIPEVLWHKEGAMCACPLEVHAVLLAYGESGLHKEGLEWAKEQASPFVKAVALAGLAEGIAKRKRSEKEQTEKESSHKEIAQPIKELLDQASKAANDKPDQGEKKLEASRIDSNPLPRKSWIVRR